MNTGGGVKSSHSKGFTLAEVLITLGIIGVVAAMTLPALIQNYQKQVLVNQLKVNVSILENALGQIAEEAGGSLAYTSYGKSIEGSATYNGSYFYPFYRDYLKKHLHIVKAVCASRTADDCPSGRLTENKYRWLISQAGSGSQDFGGNSVALANGAYVAFNIEAPNRASTGADFRTYHCGATPHADISSMKTLCGSITIDVSGEKGPNQIGYDMFNLLLDDRGHLWGHAGQQAMLAILGTTEGNDYWKNSKYMCCSKKDSGCSWSQGWGCSARVMESDWKIDY